MPDALYAEVPDDWLFSAVMPIWSPAARYTMSVMLVVDANSEPVAPGAAVETTVLVPPDVLTKLNWLIAVDEKLLAVS